MNIDEFEDWRLHLKATFPDTAGWLNSKGPLVRHQWFVQVFSFIDLSDATNALDHMLRGDCFKPHRAEDLPAAIRSHARRRAHRIKRIQNLPVRPKAKLEPGEMSMVKKYEEAVKKRKAIAK